MDTQRITFEKELRNLCLSEIRRISTEYYYTDTLPLSEKLQRQHELQKYFWEQMKLCEKYLPNSK